MLTVRPTSLADNLISSTTFCKIRLSTVLVGNLSFRNGLKAIQDLATQLNREITARIVQKLKNHLSLSHQINQANQVLFNQKLELI